MKTCSMCKKSKLKSEFYKSSHHTGGLQPFCHDCVRVCREKYRSNPIKLQQERTANRRWRKSHPENVRTFTRRRHLKVSFGITIEKYEHLFTIQNGRCAICGKQETAVLKEKVIRLAVDHNHQTGKIRGLLCGRCNTALGLFQNNINILKQAIDYLRLHDCIDGN